MKFLIERRMDEFHGGIPLAVADDLEKAHELAKEWFQKNSKDPETYIKVWRVELNSLSMVRPMCFILRNGLLTSEAPK